MNVMTTHLVERGTDGKVALCGAKSPTSFLYNIPEGLTADATRDRITCSKCRAEMAASS